MSNVPQQVLSHFFQSLYKHSLCIHLLKPRRVQGNVEAKSPCSWAFFALPSVRFTPSLATRTNSFLNLSWECDSLGFTWPNLSVKMWSHLFLSSLIFTVGLPLCHHLHLDFHHTILDFTSRLFKWRSRRQWKSRRWWWKSRWRWWQRRQTDCKD